MRAEGGGTGGENVVFRHGMQDLILNKCNKSNKLSGNFGNMGNMTFCFIQNSTKYKSASCFPRNIVVEDPRPTLQHFMVAMQGVEPWSNPEKKRDPGDLIGILFQVISIS